MNHQDHTQPPAPISLSQASKFWFKLGLISFGGPAGQIAILHQELVTQRRWISEKRFLHALNYCMLLPGPEAQQLATYLGWLMHRTPGALVAGGLFVLPSLVILIFLSWLYLTFGHTSLVAGLFAGVKPAITAIILHAAWRIGSRALKHRGLWLIAAAALCAIVLLQVPFPLIVFSAALIGWAGSRFAPQVFSANGGHEKAASRYGAALIDDHTPSPPHTIFQRARFLRTLAAALLLWTSAMVGLVAWFGWQGMLSQMAWFFTKASLLTFGGAYAVLPYVFDGAVQQFAWLNAAQMLDGLALGETTPGPLIMVVAFVGFVGAWQQAILGLPWLSGIVAACVVTFFTFLPSFSFILLGGPWVESSRNNLRLSAPLLAITAAVVGVMISLALFFAQHVLWPQGFAAPLDRLALGLGCAAAAGLFLAKRSTIEIITASALVGLGLRLGGWY